MLKVVLSTKRDFLGAANNRRTGLFLARINKLILEPSSIRLLPGLIVKSRIVNKARLLGAANNHAFSVDLQIAEKQQIAEKRQLFSSSTPNIGETYDSFLSKIRRNSNIAVVTNDPIYLKSMAEIAQASSEPLSIIVLGVNSQTEQELEHKLGVDKENTKVNVIPLSYTFFNHPIDDKAIHLEKSILDWYETNSNTDKGLLANGCLDSLSISLLRCSSAIKNF